MLYNNIMNKRIVIEIDAEDKNKFKSVVAGEGKTMKEKIYEMIKEYLNKN